MILEYVLDDGAFPIARAHDTDAGVDIRSRDDAVVRAGESVVFYTGVHVNLPEGYAGLLVSKSGLNVHNNIISTGLIDEGYTGEIVAKLYNLGDEPFTVCKGDKITQLVLIPVSYAQPVKVENVLTNTARGDNGFGSTGR